MKRLLAIAASVVVCASVVPSMAAPGALAGSRVVERALPELIGSTVVLIQTGVALDHVIDLRGGATTRGTVAQIYTANLTDAQQFVLWPVSGTSWVNIKNPASNKCLDVKDGKAVAGTPVQLWDCNSTKAQQWRFVTAGTNELGQAMSMVTSALGTNLVLDVTGGKTANSVPLQLWGSNNTKAQRFRTTTMSANCKPSSGSPPSRAFTVRYLVSSSLDSKWTGYLDAGWARWNNAGAGVSISRPANNAGFNTVTVEGYADNQSPDLGRYVYTNLGFLITIYRGTIEAMADFSGTQQSPYWGPGVVAHEFGHALRLNNDPFGRGLESNFSLMNLLRDRSVVGSPTRFDVNFVKACW